MLQVLWGPRGAGKRQQLLDRVKAGLDTGLQQLILVPETMSHTWERALLQHCGNRAGQTCRVVSFSSLSKRILADAGHDPTGILDAGGRILTMYRAIRTVEPALKYYRGVPQKPALITSMLDLCEEFQSCGIEPKRLLEDGSLGDKIRDLGQIYAMYRELCAAQGGTGMDRLGLAAGLIGGGALTGCRIFVYGFSGFTRLEYDLLGALLRVCGEMTVALMLDEDPDLFAEQHRTMKRLQDLAADRSVPFRAARLEKQRKDTALDHLNRHFLDFAATPYAGECRDITLYKVRDTASECALAAAICRRRALTGQTRMRDIAVVCGDMESYREELSRAFARFEVPVYLSQQCDLLQKTPVAALLAALQAVQDGYRTETMLSYLKSGLLSIDRRSREQLENYINLWNIRGSRWERSWTWSTDGYESAGDPELLSQLEQLRQVIIAPLTGLKNGLKHAVTGAELSDCLAHFLDALGYEKLVEDRMRHLSGSDRRQEAAEYAQIYQILKEALGQIKTALSDMTLDPAELIYLLRLELGQYKIGSIPVSLDSVNTGDFTRIGQNDVDCLILLGAVEGLFPPANAGSSLLTEQERIALEGAEIYLTQNEEYRSLEQESMLYRAVSCCRELILVRPEYRPNGDEARDSYVLKSVTDLIPGLPVLDGSALLAEAALTAKTPAMEAACCEAGGDLVPGGAAAMEYFAEKHDKQNYFTALSAYGKSGRGPIQNGDIVKKLYGDRIRLTATRADKVNACKFSYFMQYGLRAKANKPAQLGATQVGTFLHAVVEQSIRLLEGRPREEYRDVVMEQVRLYAATLGGLENMSGRERALYRSMGEMALEIVINVMDELRSSDFKPLAFEMDFGKNDQQPLELKDGDLTVTVNGSIDRVDGYVRGDTLYLKVIDYKTGTKKFDLSDVLSGINLQMFLYMLMLERTGTDRILNAAKERSLAQAGTVAPAAALYIPAKVDYSPARWDDSAEDRSARSDEARRRLGIVVEDDDLIEAMEHRGEQGYRFLPLKLTKSGYSSTSSLISAEHMGKLVRLTEETILQLGRSLQQGCVEADPYRKDSTTTACDWCDFRAACQFDESTSRDCLRRLKKYTKDQIREFLDGKEEDHGDQIHG